LPQACGFTNQFADRTRPNLGNALAVKGSRLHLTFMVDMCELLSRVSRPKLRGVLKGVKGEGIKVIKENEN
jgi:hypothetical protein